MESCGRSVVAVSSLQDAGHEALSVPDNLDRERLLYISNQLKGGATMLLSNPAYQDVGDVVGAAKPLQAAALSLGAKPQGRAVMLGDGHFEHNALLMINSLLQPLNLHTMDPIHLKELEYNVALDGAPTRSQISRPQVNDGWLFVRPPRGRRKGTK